MSWTTLGNGVCPPAPPEPFRFVQVTSGQVNQAAIDNQGRLFTWGGSDHNGSSTGQTPIPVDGEDAFLMHPAINTSTSSLRDMQYPYQVGTKSDWTKVIASESTYVALDSSGSLYGWGASDYGITGIEVDEGYFYNNTLDKWERPGNTLIIPTLINADHWTDFALGWYHILAQKADKSLWIWGANLDNTYGTASYTADYISTIPIQVTWLPTSPVKLFDADYSTSIIITESNEVWVWGDYKHINYAIPTQIPLILPLGTTIIKCQCSWSGFGVLLSNGNIYCAGEYLSFVDVPYSTPNLTLIPGAHNFKDLRIFSDGAIALDNTGNLWGWGLSTYLISQNDITCDLNVFEPGEEPHLTAANDIGARQYVTMDIGGWTHCAINSKGELFTWGYNAYSELGVNLTVTALNHSCSVLQVANPTLDNGVFAYEEQSGSETGASITRITIPEQTTAHDPCGHWHKGGGDISRKLTEFAANCWEPTIATDGSHVLYVIAGRHRPNELYMLRYDIPTNIWTEVLFRKDVLHSNWDGGAATKSGIHVYHNYAYDITGEQFNESTSNPRTITYVTYSGGTNIKEWLGTSELHARNKVAVADGGKVACIIRVGSTWEVQVSSNYGAGWSLLQTLPTTITDASVAINPNDGLVYVAAVNQAADSLLLYVGNINGTGWALKSTTIIMDASHRVYFRIDGTRLHATVESNIGTKFFYSTNNGTSFIAKDLHESIIHFAATDTLLYNLADGPDWRTDDYEAASITWDQITQFETLIERCTLHNSGTTAVYCQAKLRVDGSEGYIVSILLSHNLGERWSEISTPLNYYETFEETLNLNDDPVWHFVPQYAKF